MVQRVPVNVQNVLRLSNMDNFDKLWVARTMVLILDGYSNIDAHRGSNLCLFMAFDWLESGHKYDLFAEKTRFLHTCATYHLI